MELIETRVGAATTLRVVGRVDGSVAKELEHKVIDAVARADRVVLDLTQMSYVSSTGLRSFVAFAKHAHAKNQMVALCGLHDEIAEIFDLGGLLQLFAIYDTVDAAIEAPSR